MLEVKNLEIKNFTPHPVVLMLDGEIVETLEKAPTGTEIRVEETTELVEFVKFKERLFPVHRKAFGAVTGLPEEVEGTKLIVSALVAQAAKNRNDLLVPDTVRNEQGHVIGLDGFFVID